jgi:hypothetical protein
LIEADIGRCEVFADQAPQDRLNSGRPADETVTPATLRALLDAHLVRCPIGAPDLAWLQRWGGLRADGVLDGNTLVRGDVRCSADLATASAWITASQHRLGTCRLGGIFTTGGFFVGPQDFYKRLRTMPAQALAKIDMTRIDFISQLYGEGDLKRAQPRKARFMNTTVMVIAFGVAMSDAFDTGQVVSGASFKDPFIRRFFAGNL